MNGDSRFRTKSGGKSIVTKLPLLTSDAKVDLNRCHITFLFDRNDGRSTYGRRDGAPAPRLALPEAQPAERDERRERHEERDRRFLRLVDVELQGLEVGLERACARW